MTAHTTPPPPYPSLKATFAEEMAECIAALINSKPTSPTTSEIKAAIVKAMGTQWIICPGYEWAGEKNQRSQALMRELWDAITSEWEEIAAKPNFAATAAVAKTLAAYDHRDAAYEITIGTPGVGPVICAKKTVSLSWPIQPQWALYVEEAQRAIAAMDGVAQSIGCSRKEAAQFVMPPEAPWNALP